MSKGITVVIKLESEAPSDILEKIVEQADENGGRVGYRSTRFVGPGSRDDITQIVLITPGESNKALIAKVEETTCLLELMTGDFKFPKTNFYALSMKETYFKLRDPAVFNINFLEADDENVLKVLRLRKTGARICFINTL